MEPLLEELHASRRVYFSAALLSCPEEHPMRFLSHSNFRKAFRPQDFPVVGLEIPA